MTVRKLMGQGAPSKWGGTKELLEKRGIREGFPYLSGVAWQYCREPPCQSSEWQ